MMPNIKLKMKTQSKENQEEQQQQTAPNIEQPIVPAPTNVLDQDAFFKHFAKLKSQIPGKVQLKPQNIDDEKKPSVKKIILDPAPQVQGDITSSNQELAQWNSDVPIQAKSQQENRLDKPENVKVLSDVETKENDTKVEGSILTIGPTTSFKGNDFGPIVQNETKCELPLELSTATSSVNSHHLQSQKESSKFSGDQSNGLSLNEKENKQEIPPQPRSFTISERIPNTHEEIGKVPLTRQVEQADASNFPQQIENSVKTPFPLPTNNDQLVQEEIIPQSESILEEVQGQQIEIENQLEIENQIIEEAPQDQANENKMQTEADEQDQFEMKNEYPEQIQRDEEMVNNENQIQQEQIQAEGDQLPVNMMQVYQSSDKQYLAGQTPRDQSGGFIEIEKKQEQNPFTGRIENQQNEAWDEKMPAVNEIGDKLLLDSSKPELCSQIQLSNEINKQDVDQQKQISFEIHPSPQENQTKASILQVSEQTPYINQNQGEGSRIEQITPQIQTSQNQEGEALKSPIEIVEAGTNLSVKSNSQVQKDELEFHPITEQQNNGEPFSPHVSPGQQKNENVENSFKDEVNGLVQQKRDVFFEQKMEFKDISADTHKGENHESVDLKVLSPEIDKNVLVTQQSPTFNSQLHEAQPQEAQVEVVSKQRENQESQLQTQVQVAEIESVIEIQQNISFEQNDQLQAKFRLSEDKENQLPNQQVKYQDAEENQVQETSQERIPQQEPPSQDIKLESEEINNILEGDTQRVIKASLNEENNPFRTQEICETERIEQNASVYHSEGEQFCENQSGLQQQVKQTQSIQFDEKPIENALSLDNSIINQTSNEKISEEQVQHQFEHTVKQPEQGDKDAVTGPNQYYLSQNDFQLAQVPEENANNADVQDPNLLEQTKIDQENENSEKINEENQKGILNYSDPENPRGQTDIERKSIQEAEARHDVEEQEQQQKETFGDEEKNLQPKEQQLVEEAENQLTSPFIQDLTVKNQQLDNNSPQSPVQQNKDIQEQVDHSHQEQEKMIPEELQSGFQQEQEKFESAIQEQPYNKIPLKEEDISLPNLILPSDTVQLDSTKADQPEHLRITQIEPLQINQQEIIISDKQGTQPVQHEISYEIHHENVNSNLRKSEEKIIQEPEAIVDQEVLPNVVEKLQLNLRQEEQINVAPNSQDEVQVDPQIQCEQNLQSENEHQTQVPEVQVSAPQLISQPEDQRMAQQQTQEACQKDDILLQNSEVGVTSTQEPQVTQQEGDQDQKIVTQQPDEISIHQQTEQTNAQDVQEVSPSDAKVQQETQSNSQQESISNDQQANTNISQVAIKTVSDDPLQNQQQQLEVQPPNQRENNLICQVDYSNKMEVEVDQDLQGDEPKKLQEQKAQEGPDFDNQDPQDQENLETSERKRRQYSQSEEDDVEIQYKLRKLHEESEEKVRQINASQKIVQTPVVEKQQTLDEILRQEIEYNSEMRKKILKGQSFNSFTQRLKDSMTSLKNQIERAWNKLSTDKKLIVEQNLENQKKKSIKQRMKEVLSFYKQKSQLDRSD